MTCQRAGRFPNGGSPLGFTRCAPPVITVPTITFDFKGDIEGLPQETVDYVQTVRESVMRRLCEQQDAALMRGLGLLTTGQVSVPTDTHFNDKENHSMDKLNNLTTEQLEELAKSAFVGAKHAPERGDREANARVKYANEVAALASLSRPEVAPRVEQVPLPQFHAGDTVTLRGYSGTYTVVRLSTDRAPYRYGVRRTDGAVWKSKVDEERMTRYVPAAPYNPQVGDLVTVSGMERPHAVYKVLRTKPSGVERGNAFTVLDQNGKESPFWVPSAAKLVTLSKDVCTVAEVPTGYTFKSATSDHSQGYVHWMKTSNGAAVLVKQFPSSRLDVPELAPLGTFMRFSGDEQVIPVDAK